jgi:hypothetical protein
VHASSTRWLEHGSAPLLRWSALRLRLRLGALMLRGRALRLHRPPVLDARRLHLAGIVRALARRGGTRRAAAFAAGVVQLYMTRYRLRGSILNGMASLSEELTIGTWQLLELRSSSCLCTSTTSKLRSS